MSFHASGAPFLVPGFLGSWVAGIRARLWGRWPQGQFIRPGTAQEGPIPGLPAQGLSEFCQILSAPPCPGSSQPSLWPKGWPPLWRQGAFLSILLEFMGLSRAAPALSCCTPSHDHKLGFMEPLAGHVLATLTAPLGAPIVLTCTILRTGKRRPREASSFAQDLAGK